MMWGIILEDVLLVVRLNITFGYERHGCCPNNRDVSKGLLNGNLKSVVKGWPGLGLTRPVTPGAPLNSS